MPTKTWAVGEEVLAADFNTYVQKQVVATFANSAGRTAALPSPVEGMLTYLEDVDSLEVYTGTAWRYLNYKADRLVTVAGRFNTTVIPASGSQGIFKVYNMQQTPTPVVNVTAETSFGWTVYRIGAVAWSSGVHQVNVYLTQIGGAALPDNTAMTVHVHATGLPVVGLVPTVGP